MTSAYYKTSYINNLIYHAMKKSLLLASFAVFATVASAQTVIGLVTPDDAAAAGLAKDKATIPGGTILVDNEAGTFALAYEDSWGTSSAGKTYKNVKVGDSEEIALNTYSGAVGNTNPTFESYEAGVMSAGAVFQIEAKKDGYMTVFTNINPNKQYLVFEGKSGALAYTLGVAGTDYKIHYATPAYTEGDDMGLIDFDAPDADKYFIAATKQQVNAEGLKGWVNKTDENDVVWADAKPSDDYTPLTEVIPGATKPAMPWNIAGFEEAPGEGTGFLTFSVMEGNTYYFSALGSKCVGAGFVYTEENPTITYSAYETTDKETGEVTGSYPEVVFPAIELGGTPEAVNGIEAAAADAPIYNMMGVRVNADAKGILIQNGKKFIRK